MLAAHAGCVDEVAAVTERGDARRAGLRGVAARAGGAARGARRVRARRGVRRARARPGRPHHWCARCKRLGYRFAIVSGGFTQVTDRLAADLGIDFARGQRARDRRRPADRRIVGRVVDRAGKADGAAPVRRARPASPRPRRSRSATAPTTSTCSTPPASASPSTPSRWCSEAARHRGQRALPRRDHVPARHQPRGGRGRRRRGRAHHPRAPGLSRPPGPGQPRPTWKSTTRARLGAELGPRHRRPRARRAPRAGSPRSSSESAAGSPSPSSRRWPGTPRWGCGRRTSPSPASAGAARSASSTTSGLPVNTASSNDTSQSRRPAASTTASHVCRVRTRGGDHGVVGREPRVAQVASPASRASAQPRGRSAGARGRWRRRARPSRAASRSGAAGLSRAQLSHPVGCAACRTVQMPAKPTSTDRTPPGPGPLMAIGGAEDKLGRRTVLNDVRLPRRRRGRQDRRDPDRQLARARGRRGVRRPVPQARRGRGRRRPAGEPRGGRGPRPRRRCSTTSPASS